MARVLCGCVGFGLRITPGGAGQNPEELSISEWRGFIRSGAPSPPERRKMGFKDYQSPRRETVMEPGTDSPFQILEKIDRIVLSRAM
jgi:hypothetical protein